MAGGFSIKKDNVDALKLFIFKKFEKKKNLLINKDVLYLDSQISASALNEEFYNKIDKLSPFGSGNPEPRFSLNDVRIIKSQIIAEKHVKSILTTKDGLTVKSISFNSSDSDLGQFLLSNNKKTFNIAGKLTLNEWKGEKNVEFIIDDISVTKN